MVNENASSAPSAGGIRLFVGLGNPGPQYERTRHNAGFACIQDWAQHCGAAFQLDKNYKGLVARTVIDGQTIFFLQPLTFMNLSGQSVAPLARFFKIAPSQILVAHDELDVEPGCMKLKYGGGHAGHNGLRSIQEQLASRDFWRLRLGIGHPGDKSEVADYVLRKPPVSQQTVIDAAIQAATPLLPALIRGEFEQAQRVLHTFRP